MLVYRYLCKKISMAVLAFMGIFSCIAYVCRLLRFIGNLDTWGHVKHDLYIALLRLPRDVYAICPVIIIIAVFYVLSRLQIKEELLAMQSLGADRYKIITKVCGIVLLISIGLVIVGEGIVPFLTYAAEQIKCQNKPYLKNGCFGGYEDWYQTGDRLVYYKVNGRESIISPVVIFNMSGDHRSLRNVIYAKEGRYYRKKWHIQGEMMYPEKNHVTRAYTIDLPLSSHDIKFSNIRKRYLPIWVLWNQYERGYDSSLGPWHKFLFFSGQFVEWLWVMLIICVFTPEFFTTLRSQPNKYRIFVKLFIVVIGYMGLNM